MGKRGVPLDALVLLPAFLYAVDNNAEGQTKEINHTEQSLLEQTIQRETADAKVLYVIDGDTIKVTYDLGYNGDPRECPSAVSIRFIGIDTPELRHGRSRRRRRSNSRQASPRREYFANEAKKRTQELVSEGYVFIAYDHERQDDYDRDLGYVYAKNKNGQLIFVNLQLVREGLARAYPYVPNTTHRDDFEQAEDEAFNRGQGIWERTERNRTNRGSDSERTHYQQERNRSYAAVQKKYSFPHKNKQKMYVRRKTG